MAEIVVLLSAGRHPVTGRLRPAESDARALQLARPMQAAGHQVTALHAGPADDPIRAYGGYGNVDLVRLDLNGDADPLPALTDWLGPRRPALILAGARAERGPASGLLPYALAKALGATCISAVTTLEALEERVTLVQALEGGRRRRLAAPAPAILMAAQAAAPPSGWAFAKAARATVRVEPAAAPSQSLPSWRIEPARPLARPVKKIRGGAAARMAAATTFVTGSGKLLVRPEAEEAARAIADYLEAEGLLRR